MTRRRACLRNRADPCEIGAAECSIDHHVDMCLSRVEVRTGTLEDVAALGTIFRDASLSNAGDRDVLLAHPAVLEFDSAPIALGAVRVAVDGDRAVGFATTTRPGTSREAELVDLFVAPASMRRGIATLLVNDARDVARKLGCELLAVTANPHADEFYAAAGFRGVEVVQTRFGAGRRLTVQV